MTKERVIISLTTWSARVGNIPAVLDTIFAQTVPPDLVVLNVSYDLLIPDIVQDYLDKHSVEVYRCTDTKVFKKLIPTLKRYPNDCVISIDDDWLYPNGMIADFLSVHAQYPQFPISGNSVVSYGYQCHCGCASLTKAEYFGNYLSQIDDKVIDHCSSDDLVYTFMASKNGRYYIRTNAEYHINMRPYNEVDSYSESLVGWGLDSTWNYLITRFGTIPSGISYYVQDPYMAKLLLDIERKSITYHRNEAMIQVRSTYAFRLGKVLLKPISLIRHIIK